MIPDEHQTVSLMTTMEKIKVMSLWTALVKEGVSLHSVLQSLENFKRKLGKFIVYLSNMSISSGTGTDIRTNG